MCAHMFIYFGYKTFQPFLKLQIENNFLPPLTVGKCFSSLKIPNETVEDIYLGWSHVYIKSDKHIYRTGYHDKPKISNGHIFSLDRIEVEEISSGFIHSCVRSKSGQCYSLKNNSIHLKAINLEQKLMNIRSLATEDLHSVLLTNDGEVYSLDFKENLLVKHLPMPIPIKEISCGKEHVLMLSCSGKVYSYGFGSKGQLGHGSIENEEKPLIIEALDGIEIKSIASGGWHSAAISKDGDLYMWGWNEKGQLGLPCIELQDGKLTIAEIETVCCLPKIIELDCQLVKVVACGSRHTAALTENNHVWTWGWNGYGQLGVKNMELTDSPRKVDLPSTFQPEKLKCKFWSTLIIGVSSATV